MGVSEREERKKRTRNIYRNNGSNFPRFMKFMNLQIQEVKCAVG
jgi:hypothetical protein